jgi:hypothetical protein
MAAEPPVATAWRAANPASPGGPKVPSKGGSASAWAQKHRIQVGAGAVAGVGGLALYRRHAAKSAPANAAGVTTIQPSATSVQPSTNDSTATDMYNALFDNLSAQLAAMSQGAGTPIASLDPGSAPSAVAPPATVAPAPPAGAAVTPVATPAVVNPLYGTTTGMPANPATPPSSVAMVNSWVPGLGMGSFSWAGNQFFGTYAQAQAAGYNGPKPPGAS